MTGQYEAQKTKRLDDIWLEIRNHLEGKKTQVQEEIVNYPPPIPACDVQFNYLLEERSKITQELRLARSVSEERINENDRLRGLREFIHSSECLDESMKDALVSTMAQMANES